MVKTIIFDYDGTIHNTLGIYEPAFREAYQWLAEQNVVEEQKIETAQIAGWLGLNSKEMWDTFLPELDQRYKDQASAIVGDSMVRQIRKHRAVWYPGAEEMLTALKNRGYHLVILSNCKVAYRKAHWEEFRMERWFEQFYDCESYGFCPKTEIVQEVIRDYPGPYLVIGDRRQDLECARSCKSPFIGCLYGYGEKGELDGADALIMTDVCPYTLGIQVWDGITADCMSTIIPRNTPIPVTKKETYWTSWDYQNKTEIAVYQGESRQVSRNHFLGNFMLEGIPERKAGEESIDVEFSYNQNGILDVKATIVSTHKDMAVTIDLMDSGKKKTTKTSKQSE